MRRHARDENTDDHEADASQGSGVAETQEEREDEVVITPDLMCSVCQRPDNEAEMLVCDCKAGYHIYCLTPRLEQVPEGDWQCPACAKKA